MNICVYEKDKYQLLTKEEVSKFLVMALHDMDTLLIQGKFPVPVEIKVGSKFLLRWQYNDLITWIKSLPRKEK